MFIYNQINIEIIGDGGWAQSPIKGFNINLFYHLLIKIYQLYLFR